MCVLRIFGMLAMLIGALLLLSLAAPKPDYVVAGLGAFFAVVGLLMAMAGRKRGKSVIAATPSSCQLCGGVILKRSYSAAINGAPPIIICPPCSKNIQNRQSKAAVAALYKKSGGA